MIKTVISTVLFLLIFVQPVCAYDDVNEYITEDMHDILPEDILYEDEVINYNSLLGFLGDSINGTVKNVLQNLMSILSVVIISSLFSIMCKSINSNSVQNSLSYLSSACIALILYGVLTSVWGEMTSLLTQINNFMVTLTPVTTLLYSLGGNITTAAVNSSAMGIILTVFEAICYHGVTPMLQICYGFSIVSALSGSVDLKPIASFVRKTYTTVLIFVMSSMICILSLQNMLTQPKDSLALRTVKFAASNSIPLVGGALGDAAATVGAGVKNIRGTFGVLAIIAIGIMVLPVILSIWFNKLAFSFGATVCSVFGLSHEGELVSSAGELLNFALAITVSTAVMFIISISIFAGASVAIGGT